MRDFSEYLSLPNKLDIEESNWLANPHLHERQAKAVNDVMDEFKLFSITEIGFGSGELAKRILNGDYYGYDANPNSVSLAAAKSGVKGNKVAISFEVADIRNLRAKKTDLVCCFAFLKHFGLHEWQTIFEKCASLGEYFVFDMQIAETTHDDGIDFHHVWKSIDGLHKSIYDAGLVLLQTIYEGDTIAPIFVCRHRSTKEK